MDQRALHSFEKLIHLTIDIPPGSAPAPFQPQPFLDQLSAYVTLQRVRKGHTIIRASQVLQDIIMVVEGEFYLLRSSNKGSSSMLARVQAPEIVGLPQLVGTDKVFYSDIIASANCLTLRVDHVFFGQCLRESKDVSMVCMKCMTRSMTRLYDQFERVSFFEASENLMAYLYRKWVEAGAGEEVLRVEEKHTLIANELGCTVRTVCRALRRLKDQDLCTTDKAGHIYCTYEQIRRIQRQVCC